MYGGKILIVFLLVLVPTIQSKRSKIERKLVNINTNILHIEMAINNITMFLNEVVNILFGIDYKVNIVDKR
jgi:hypothetical protein